jgi:hypothetical protein
MIRAFLLAVFLFAILLFAIRPLAAQESPAPPPALPALPADIAPLSAALKQRLQELLAAAEKIRGLKAKHPVPAGIVEEKDLPAKIAESLREEMPPERLRAAEIGLKAFGLLPESLDLSRYYPELLASQVAGYYDPGRRYLTVVHHPGGLPKTLEEIVLVHELTHALQDQAFDLQHFLQDDPLSDEATARTALVEGDASLVMFDFFNGENGEKAAKPAVTPEADVPGAKEMAAAPRWLRDTLEFGYLEGYLFCLSVRQKGGQKLLDSAFSQDPPRSSEQIFHPEKWHTRRDDPIVLPWPDLARELSGGRKVAEGQLGELGIGILLREITGDRQASETAAAGWGGDRFAVYEKDGRRLLAWLTEWDSEADAKELREAARRLGRSWSVETVAPRRVILLHGPWKRREAKAVRAALAAVQAGRPENRMPGLAALGPT